MSFPPIESASQALGASAPREALHRRDYLFDGYRREDGHYDIEGRIVDRKHYAFPNRWRGEVQRGEALHDMVVRLTVDRDYRLLAIEVKTLSSPFSLCPDIEPQFQSLVGAKLTRGWSKILAEKVGGVKGCTHINEMLRLMGTIAFQTIGGDHRRRAQQEGRTPEAPRPGFLDSCHALASSSPVVAEHWPDFYEPDLAKPALLD